MYIKRVKNIAALLLLICLVLPVSRCAKLELPHPPEEANVQEKESIEYSYLIPITEIEIKNPSTYLILLAFIWPFPFWLIKSKYVAKLSVRIFIISEFILISFSWFLISGILFFKELLCGGYIAVASMTVLSLLFLYQAVSDLKLHMKE